MTSAVKLVKNYVDEDFSGKDFRGESLSGAVYHQCSFDGANLSEVDCSYSDFSGSTFRNTNCYRTNFAHSKLAATVFEPSDCYGMTMTFECKTFENMRISQLYWYSWLMFAASMVPASGPVKDDIKSLLIGGVIGAERYIKLRDLFRRRDM